MIDTKASQIFRCLLTNNAVMILKKLDAFRFLRLLVYDVSHSIQTFKNK